MRRLLLLLAPALLAIGCGAERPDGVAQGGGSVSPRPTTASTPTTPTTTPTTTPAPPAAPSGPLAGFPLALGYAAENGDDHSPVVVTDRPGLRRLDPCEHLGWDPRAGTTGLIGVEFRGEAEWSRGRTLVLYPSEAAAADAVDVARDAVAGCPEEPGEEGYGTTHDLVDSPLGDQSVAWADTYWSTGDGERLHDTGLTVYHLVRVGRAVLGSYEYGEGNGSPDGRERAVTAATDAERPVVTAMQDLRPGDPPVLTHQGIGPYRVGMSAEELIAAGGPLDSDQADPCSALTWTGPDGARLTGAFSTGTGLAYLTVAGGITPEGVSLGTPLADLAAAYPDLDGDERVTRVTLPGTDGYYRFEVEGGQVSWLGLVDLDQQCVS